MRHATSTIKVGDVALPVLSFRPIVVASAKGSYVTDTANRTYLDVNSGQFCSIFGHSDFGVSTSLREALDIAQNTDTSTLSVQVVTALKRMLDLVPEIQGAKGILLSTGGEANEFALKYAKHLKERDGVLSFDRGYHGLSHGTAAYSMSRQRIRPPLQNSYAVSCPISFDRSPGDDFLSSVSELESVVKENHKSIAAMIFEPVVSGGGMIFPPVEYFSRVRELCNEYDIVLIFDECQTGMGRLGNWFGFQRLGVVPDILVTSKALGAGFPVASVVMAGHLIPESGFKMQYFSSHQNEPFAGTIVNHVISEIESEGFLERNVRLGGFLLQKLSELSGEFSNLMWNVRGEGLMIAFDVVPRPFEGSATSPIGGKLTQFALEEGLLIQSCNFERTFRLLPNYRVSEEEIMELVAKLRRALIRMAN